MNYFFFLPPAWARSDAATDFSAFVDFGFRRISEAFDATFGLVCLGFLAIVYPFVCKMVQG